MTFRAFSFYRTQDGMFIDQVFRTNAVGDIDAQIRRMTPEGCRALDGEYDRLSQRVDTHTGLVIDYQPSQPNDQYRWIESENGQRVMRWVLKPEAASRKQRREDALAQMDLLEKRQLRIDREVRLRPNEVGEDGKTPLQRLEELDDEMSQLRSVINGETETTARQG